jgi:ABC-type uncharacterized transport system involved in gliding motility auxiliary subunit
MKLVDKITGGVSILLVLFALIYYTIQNIWSTLNWITLVLGVIGIAYYLFTYYRIREKDISKRSLQYGSNVIVQIIVVLAIISLLSFISTRQHLRSDWTKNKLFSLADQTEKMLSGLDKEVTAMAFYRASEQRNARDLLDEYGFRSDNFVYEFVDPDEQPQIARRYNITQYNTVVLEAGIKRETISELSELNLTNALVKVTRDQDKVIYFLTGHGERSIAEEGPEGYKRATEAIRNENHLVKELNLVRRISQGKGIPDSCTVLVMASPKTNFFPTELDSIRTYVDRGGKLFVLLDPDWPAEMGSFLENYKVTMGQDMVVDASGMGRLFGAGPGMPLVTNYDQSIRITKEFNVMTFYPYASSVTPMSEKDGYTVKELLKTSPNSWAEKDYKQRQVELNEGRDLAGPITIACLIEKTIGDNNLSLAVFGDSDFAKNGFFQNQGNADLFLNTINYLAEEEDMISIRPKEVDDRRVSLTQADVKTIFYLVVIAIPLLVIIAGVVFYIKRGK